MVPATAGGAHNAAFVTYRISLSSRARANITHTTSLNSYTETKGAAFFAVFAKSAFLIPIRTRLDRQRRRGAKTRRFGRQPLRHPSRYKLLTISKGVKARPRLRFNGTDYLRHPPPIELVIAGNYPRVWKRARGFDQWNGLPAPPARRNLNCWRVLFYVRVLVSTSSVLTFGRMCRDRSSLVT